MKNIVEIKKMLSIINSIEGWLTESEQLALLHLPLLVDHLPGKLVEIGSYKGKSTITLALGSCWISSQKRPIYSIDPFAPEEHFYTEPYFDIFLANIKKHHFGNQVIPIKKYSTQAYSDCPQSIAALFIDGDHEYAGVKHDIVHYASRLVPGGLAAFHDYSAENGYPGVQKAVNELGAEGGFRPIGLYDSLLVLQKL